MEKIKGFEIVEQFLDKWKSDSTEWWLDQWKKYGEAVKDRKENPSKASQLYYSGSNEEKEAFLAELYERDSESNMWKVPKKRNWCDGNNYRLEGTYNALVHTMNLEYEKFQERWSYVIKMKDRINVSREDRNTFEKVLEFTLQQEYERKYKKLVSDCFKITGGIKKADLRISHATGNIEGFIYGEIGNAELWSTLSGGEVQCLHLRFYCHKR